MRPLLAWLALPLGLLGCASSDEAPSPEAASTAGTGATGGQAGSPGGPHAGQGGASSGGAGSGGAAGQGQAGSNHAGGGQAGQGNAGQGNTGSGQAGSGQAGSGQAGGGQAGSGQAGSGQAGGSQVGPGRGFPATGPWASFYGPASGVDLARLASTFRVINLDADPDAANITPDEIEALKAGGKNRVISYLDVGSCESYRSYWDSVPAGFTSCHDNVAAQLGPYDGYPDETWMNPANPEYQRLIVEHVAPRLAARGVDGFFLDNLEIVTHGTDTTNGPCDADCAQGGLDLVRQLREAFPQMLIVMQNGTSDVTRLGTTGGLDYPSLLDGISHEEVFAPTPDPGAEAELLAWKKLGLTPGGRPFFLGIEDYVDSCSATDLAKKAYNQGIADGFSPCESDASASMQSVCFWPWL